MTEETVNNTIAAIKGIPTREKLIEMLQGDICEVTFNKLSGDERTITCTLVAFFLPEAKQEDALSQTKIRNLESKNIVVWDLHAKTWKSFRYDRVTKVKVNDRPTAKQSK